MKRSDFVSVKRNIITDLVTVIGAVGDNRRNAVEEEEHQKKRRHRRKKYH
jgi:hypothetical protein